MWCDEVTSVRYMQCGSSFARGLDNLDSGNIPWRLNAKQSGGGLIMDMGCHILDRIDYLFGPVVDVKSTVLRKGGDSSSSYPLVEDYVSMSGTIGKCHWSAISSEGASVECIWDFSPNAEDEDGLIISGPKGSLRMAGMGAGFPIEVLDANGKLIRKLEFDPPEHAAQPLIQSVANDILGSDMKHRNENKNQQSTCSISSTGRQCRIRTSEVLDAILGSYYGGRHDEFWIRTETWPGLKAT